MDNFVLSGKAETVFRLIDLKAKQEEAKKAAAEIDRQTFNLRQLNHMYESEHRRGEPCPHNKAIVRCQVYPCLGRACQPGKESN